MRLSVCCGLWLAVMAMPALAAGSDPQQPAPPPDDNTAPPVTLTINPDGTAVWDGQPLTGVPDLKDKLAHKTQQDPKLQLDLRFHTVGELSDSNRQTLLDVLELAAKFGYVHVEQTNSGARLTVLGPGAVEPPAK